MKNQQTKWNFLASDQNHAKKIFKERLKTI